MALISGCSEKDAPANIDEVLALKGWRKEPLDYNPDGSKFGDDVAVAEAYKKNLEKEEEKEMQSAQKTAVSASTTQRKNSTPNKKNDDTAMINKWGVDLTSLKGAKYIKVEEDTEEIEIIEEADISNKPEDTKSKTNTRKKTEGQNNKKNTSKNISNKEKQKYATIIYTAQQPLYPQPMSSSANPAPGSSRHGEGKPQSSAYKMRYTKTAELNESRLTGDTFDSNYPPKPRAKYTAWDNNAYEPHMFRNMELAGEHINAIHDIFKPYPVTTQATPLPKVYHIAPKKLN